MKIAGGLIEDGLPVGNAFDKHGSFNPVVRWIMNGFDKTLSDFVNYVSPETIHETGCGEGFWVFKWKKEGYEVKGSDFSRKIIDIAQDNAVTQGFYPDIFKVRSIYELNNAEDSADLVVCIEVLEHLEYPEEALKTLRNIAKKYVIFSVPREPIWRVLNMLRGKYVFNFGNTPGHIQHWSKYRFIRLIEKYFEIIQVKNPLPWTMILCHVRN